MSHCSDCSAVVATAIVRNLADFLDSKSFERYGIEHIFGCVRIIIYFYGDQHVRATLPMYARMTT